MGNVKPARRLSRATRTGLRDLPSNAAWLVSKALTPVLSVGEGASKAVSSVGEGVSGDCLLGGGDGGSRGRKRPAEGEGRPAVNSGSRARPRPRFGRFAYAAGRCRGGAGAG
jgi:hypothetical protein